VLAQQLFVEKTGLPPALLDRINRLAAFQNPQFYEKQAMRLSTTLTPRIISCAEELAAHIGLPRGCRSQLEELLARHGVQLAVDDQRIDGEPLDLRFHGKLTNLQERAARALQAHDIGVFSAPPGTGKTVVGAHLIASRGRSTLVVVHRSQLVDQWRTQLALFLDLKPGDIGQIGAGKRKITGALDVAMIQSLTRRGKVDDIVATYGHVLVDECHHVPAVSFERAMREVRARYVAGLTATPTRRDGHHPILEFQLGPIRHVVDPRKQAARHPLEHRLVVRETSFRLGPSEDRPRIQELYSRLAGDAARNTMILDDVINSLEHGRSPIVLTERRDHLEYLAEELGAAARNVIVLRGGMSVKQRRAAAQALASIPDEEERLVLATGRFIGEGFDDARLDTLFLTMPVAWKGTLVQYAGRLHRTHQGKAEVRVFDYVDEAVPMLARMFKKRLKGYRAMGYEVVGSSGAAAASGEPVVEYDDEARRRAGA
jgi:superfamily II DNA or RNA helicase